MESAVHAWNTMSYAEGTVLPLGHWYVLYQTKNG